MANNTTAIQEAAASLAYAMVAEIVRAFDARTSAAFQPHKHDQRTQDGHAVVPRLMSPKQASEATTFSRAMLSTMAEAGTFPKPVKLGDRRIAFVRAEVEEWLDAKIGLRK